ncbi:MAG: FAD-binding oxidoreductase [Alphaproteobacteria bacterium]|nr:FAD-binding oxidoreductase [Alphaproteobacteria bacterium]
MKLSGWGRYPVLDCRVHTPRSPEAVRGHVGDGPLIPRGNGRSYGDSALNTGCTLSTARLNHMLSFDAEAAVLACESGVLLADILNVFVPRGFFPPVTPGTKHVSVGGMIAADVHGKNHHVAGSFGRHVLWMDIMVGSGEVMRCSADKNAELFHHTIGGMGLTGVILRAAFKLVPVESAFILSETLAAGTLDEVMEIFEDSALWTYSVAWIDCSVAGPALGRSIFYRGEHCRLGELTGPKRASPNRIVKRKTRNIPVELPGWVLNRSTMKALNALYYWWGRLRPRVEIVDYDSFFYPLDALGEWFRLYGRGGFLQYQCVLPKNQSREGLTRILAAVARSGQASPLSVLKLFGPQEGVLSFPMEGYTLALDFPARPRVFDLLDRLDGIVADHGGHIYLAKDSRMAAAAFKKTQPNVEQFADFREAQSAAEHFASHQSERLEL